MLRLFPRFSEVAPWEQILPFALLPATASIHFAPALPIRMHVRQRMHGWAVVSARAALSRAAPQGRLTGAAPGVVVLPGPSAFIPVAALAATLDMNASALLTAAASAVMLPPSAMSPFVVTCTAHACTQLDQWSLEPIA